MKLLYKITMFEGVQINCFQRGSTILTEYEFVEVGFVKGVKPENVEKNVWRMTRANNKVNQDIAMGGTRTSTILVRGPQRSNECACLRHALAIKHAWEWFAGTTSIAKTKRQNGGRLKFCCF